METLPAISLYELEFTFLITLQRSCFLPPALILYPSALWRLLKCVQAPVSLQIALPPLSLSLSARAAHLGGAEV